MQHVVIVQVVVDVVKVIDVETCVVKLFEPLSSLQVPEFVEKSVVFLLLESLHYSVQIAFTHMPWCFHCIVPGFDVDNLLAGLDSSRQLRVDAFTDKDDFNECEVRQMQPGYGRERIERVGHEIWDVSKR